MGNILTIKRSPGMASKAFILSQADCWCRPGALVTSQEGMRVQKKVWDEILEILIRRAPEISLFTSGGQ